MVFCGQLSGLKGMKRAQLHRIWSISAKSYSKDVSKQAYAFRGLSVVRGAYTLLYSWFYSVQ